jgi:HAD superfamily hydrolase (TIGR01490 family)
VSREESRWIAEIREVTEKCRDVAAFFDLDGTLAQLPSMEWRFFGQLRRNGEIPARNYLLWMAEALRLAPRGIAAMRHANKRYLEGLSHGPEFSEREQLQPCATTCDQEVRANRLGMTRAPVPEFFPRGVQRVEWHARAGHAIFLVSGAPEPLVRIAALALVVRLAARGVPARVGVSATRLEALDGKWTGRILGEAMVGEAKACAVRKIAARQGFELQKCYAYGDSANDRWMLRAVGRPTAVNPSEELGHVAGLAGWPVMLWKNAGNPTPETAGAPPKSRNRSPREARRCQVNRSPAEIRESEKRENLDE